MGAGETILIATGEENRFINSDPQITFFKNIYRRYTNFSIETVINRFKYNVEFGKKYSCQISRLGDLIHKVWLVLTLPSIPTLYNFDNIKDNKIRVAWARKIAYSLLDYIEIEIGGQTIDKHYGEWMNTLDELNFIGYDKDIKAYIGDVPELYEYTTPDKKKGYTLNIPIQFWFCRNSGLALPILCMQYSTVRLNISVKEFENCFNITPTHYIKIDRVYGFPIQDEELYQISPTGVTRCYFDSLEFDETGNHILYYKKITDNNFTSTQSSYLSNININNILDKFLNNDQKSNYIIYGLKSKSIIIPVSLENSFTSVDYLIKNIAIPSLTDAYFLIDYIYLDKEERERFYKTKHDYVIEQLFYSGNRYLQNLNNKCNFNIINPAKFFVFMGQVPYMGNINNWFNYVLQDKELINTISIDLNATAATAPREMEYYTKLQPFLFLPRTNKTNGIGFYTFSIYPTHLQPSGSCNLSNFNEITVNIKFNNIDSNYNNYIFKLYSITYNILRIDKGMAGLLFTNSTK